MLRVKKRVIYLSVCLLMSCSHTAELSGQERTKTLDQLKYEHNQRLKTTHLIYMPPEDMFPDPQVRALAKAASRGQIEKINQLGASGVDVNAKGALGATPLFLAFGNIDGFKRLLELGADPNAQYEDGGSIVLWAVEYEKTDFLKLAIQYGADINLINPYPRTSGETPLIDAIKLTYDESVPILLDAGADVNMVIKIAPHTAYSGAAMQGKFEYLLQMLQMGADYTYRSPRGWPLRYGIAFGERQLRYNKQLARQHAQYLSQVKTWLKQRGVIVPSVEEWEAVHRQLGEHPHVPITEPHPVLMSLGLKE